MNRARFQRRLEGAAWTTLVWWITLLWALWVTGWPMDRWQSVAAVLAVGAVAGVGGYLFEHSALLWRLVRGDSLALLLAVRIAAYLVLIGGAILALAFLAGDPGTCALLPGMDRDSCGLTGIPVEFWTAPRIGTLVGALAGMAILINFGRELAGLVGPRTLVQILFETHRRPVAQERVFLFLDLDDSTALSERLGSMRFAKLKADFFRDLSDPVYATRGRILEYAGDEALISWPDRDGRGTRRAARCFYGFADLMAQQADRYRERHDCVPTFKGAMASGTVVGMGLGDLRTQVVYSGDALNTAGRLLSWCHRLGARLLAPAAQAPALEGLNWIRIVPLGEVELKGLEAPLEVIAVEDARD